MRRFLGMIAVLTMLLSVNIIVYSEGPVLPGEEDNSTIIENYNKS